MDNELDYRILRHIKHALPEKRICEIENVLADNFDEYMRFREIEGTAGTGLDQTSLSVDELRKNWVRYTKLNNNRFDKLVETYFDRYKENAKKRNKKGTVTELNIELSGHNKWYRMLKDHGIGAKYHDDMRKLCFLFELSYLESIELLWSAGHPFDNDSTRDYVIAECLVQKIYEQEEVDKRLAALGQPVLFQNGK